MKAKQCAYCGNEAEFAVLVFVQTLRGRRERQRVSSNVLHCCHNCADMALPTTSLAERLRSVLARIRNASGEGSTAKSELATCSGEFTTSDATDTVESSPESLHEMASRVLSRAGVELPTCGAAEREARSGAESDGAV